VIEFSGRGILLDIEGTTSSIAFVYDEMFPFVRREIGPFLESTWHDEATRHACSRIAADEGLESREAWFVAKGANGEKAQQKLVHETVARLMDSDAKTTGLKQIQGLIWQAGFESGELNAHVYEDVPLALRAWRERQIDLRIYSSGSVAAQKLCFGHTVAGDLLPLLSGHYDTTTGPKKDSSSYQAIASHWQLPASKMLFLSDVPAELDAATSAGMQTALCVRPGNAPVKECEHPKIATFGDVQLT